MATKTIKAKGVIFSLVVKDVTASIDTYGRVVLTSRSGNSIQYSLNNAEYTNYSTPLSIWTASILKAKTTKGESVFGYKCKLTEVTELNQGQIKTYLNNSGVFSSSWSGDSLLVYNIQAGKKYIAIGDCPSTNNVYAKVGFMQSFNASGGVEGLIATRVIKYDDVSGLESWSGEGIIIVPNSGENYVCLNKGLADGNIVALYEVSEETESNSNDTSVYQCTDHSTLPTGYYAAADGALAEGVSAYNYLSIPNNGYKYISGYILCSNTIVMALGFIDADGNVIGTPITTNTKVVFSNTEIPVNCATIKVTFLNGSAQKHTQQFVRLVKF